MFPDLIQPSGDRRTRVSAIGYGLPLLAGHLHSTLACRRAECLQKTFEWLGTRAMRRLGSWLPTAMLFGAAALAASLPDTFRCATSIPPCLNAPLYPNYPTYTPSSPNPPTP